MFEKNCLIACYKIQLINFYSSRYFRGIEVDLFNVKSEIWRQSQSTMNSFTKFIWNVGWYDNVKWCLNWIHYRSNIYLFQVNNRNTSKKCKICSKLTLKTPERRHLFLLFPLLTSNRSMLDGVITFTIVLGWFLWWHYVMIVMHFR